MRATIAISFKPGVLDPEALAIGRALKGLGFTGVGNVRRTKLIEVDLEAADAATAEAQARAMCEKLLANPVIETFTVEITS